MVGGEGGGREGQPEISLLYISELNHHPNCLRASKHPPSLALHLRFVKNVIGYRLGLRLSTIACFLFAAPSLQRADLSKAPTCWSFSFETARYLIRERRIIFVTIRASMDTTTCRPLTFYSSAPHKNSLVFV